MAGPPMSMFSIASSSVQPALATVASNGYRLTTSRSMVSMPWACKCRHVLGQVAARQQAAMHLGVQRLDAAVEHFGKAGDLGHLGHGQALVGQQLGGAAGGNQLDAQRVQGLGEFDDAGFVGDGEQCVHGMVATGHVT